MRVDVAANVDLHHAKEVHLAIQGQGEDVPNHTHVAGKLDLEQIQIGLTIDSQVEIGLGRNGVAVQGGVGQRAGVDLQDRTALDLDDGNVELNFETQVQRKVRVVVGIQAKSGRARDGHLTKRPQLKRNVHRSLNAVAVDQQINGALHRQGPDVNFSAP